MQEFPLVAYNLVPGLAPPQEACMRACSSYESACLIIIPLKPVITMLTFHQINEFYILKLFLHLLIHTQ